MSSDLYAEYKPLITSHCFVWAFEFLTENARHVDGDDDNVLSTPFPICTARLRRAMLPNLLVQAEHEFSQNTIDTFLHDAVRPSLPMSFCFFVSVSLETATPESAVATVRHITAMMPHLCTLLIVVPDEFYDLELQLQFADALPASGLWRLRLWRYDAAWSGDFMTRLSTRCNNLVRLEISELFGDAHDVLFNAEENPFPCLRHLTATAAYYGVTQEFFERTYSSPVVQKLDVFSFGHIDINEDFFYFPAPSLKGF